MSLQLKRKFKYYISDLNSFVIDNNNQYSNSMKAIKIEQHDFNESISNETSNSNEKNKGTNFKKVIKLHGYLS